RRLEPLDRVRELGDASVPFSFDVHAMIYSDDAPSLENHLHKVFNEKQVNKINSRKEFFNVNLKEIKSVIEDMNINAHWTMFAEAKEYRESLSIEQERKAATSANDELHVA
ncbi:GIY-YIG nuclease family protein, partial [Escherichia coli]